MIAAIQWETDVSNQQKKSIGDFRTIYRGK